MQACVSFRSVGSFIALVLREQRVEGSARLGEDAASLGDLVCAAEAADLAGGHPHSPHFAEQRADVVVDGAGHLLPWCTEVGAALVDVGPPGVGEHVRTTFVDLFGADQAFVLELGERWVDRPWAWPPDAVRALLDLLHELVAVPRSLRQEQQRRGADIATAGPRPAWEPTRPTDKGAESFPAPGPRPVAAAASSSHRQRGTRRQEAERPTRTAETQAGPLGCSVHGHRVTRYIEIARVGQF